MQYVSTVTSKGQVLIPGDIRKMLAIQPKDRMVFRVSGDEMVATKAPSVEEMFGFVKTNRKLSDVELEKKINQAVELGMTE